MLKGTCKRLVAVLLLSAPTAGMAFNVTVDNFGGAGNSTNGSFVGGVWTPTADSNLDVADLQAALDAGNAGITTNGAGDIVFNDATPAFSTAAARNLSFQAQGSVTLNKLEAAAPSPLNVSITASGDVTVEKTTTKTFGGDFAATGTVIVVKEGGLDTTVDEETVGGDINLNATGGVTLTSVKSGGGNYSSSGTDFSCGSACIQTAGGNIALNHTGSVNLMSGGATTGGGNYSSTGTDFSCSGNCIATAGGNVNLSHTGNLTVTQGGIGSGGGKIVAKAAGDIAVSNNGVQSGGGDITIYYGNNLSLASASKIVSGDSSTPGGEIILHAVNSMTIDGEVSSASGSGGTLSVDDGVTVGGSGATTAGAGDVSLYLRSQPQILDILGLAVIPVPTLGALGTGVLAGLMLLLGWHRRRATA